jgi:hypothetical protein
MLGSHMQGRRYQAISCVPQLSSECREVDCPKSSSSFLSGMKCHFSICTELKAKPKTACVHLLNAGRIAFVNGSFAKQMAFPSPTNPYFFFCSILFSSSVT